MPRTNTILLFGVGAVPAASGHAASPTVEPDSYRLCDQQRSRRITHTGPEKAAPGGTNMSLSWRFRAPPNQGHRLQDEGRLGSYPPRPQGKKRKALDALTHPEAQEEN